jgi:RsmE family RNA methyltransferase
LNLVLIERDDVRGAGAATLSGVRAAHVRNVLKAEPGKQIRIGIVDGPLGQGTVQSVAEDTVELRCVFDADPPPRPRVDLLLALPRPKVMRRLWAQLAALGVGQIILTNAERVERNYFDTNILSPDVYRPLLLEGLQQARDTWVPRVSIHRQFRILVEDHLDHLSPGGLRLVADPAATLSVTSACQRGGSRVDERLLLAIGPEGGWNAFEVALLEAHAFRPVGLGTRTLRSDTAAVALLAVVHAAL